MVTSIVLTKVQVVRHELEFDPVHSELQSSISQYFEYRRLNKASLDEFHLRWLNIKECDAAFAFSITLFLNRLN